MEPSGARIVRLAEKRPQFQDGLGWDSIMERQSFPLNQRWLYSDRFEPEHMRRQCDESDFAEVSVPHCNRRTPYNGFDEKCYQFISAYRRHFVLPHRVAGARVLIGFDGVMAAATVHVNGVCVGEHKGGYTPFTMDVTEHVDWSGDNVLSVKVDSRERPDIPPFGGLMDYLAYGGIYRDVSLRIVNGVYFERVFVKPKGITAGTPRLEVECRLRNTRAAALAGRLSVEVVNEGAVIARGGGDIAVSDAASSQASVVIENPPLALWDLGSPVLYHAVCALRIGAEVVDRYETRFGFRDCAFRPEGFTLNGKILGLRGLNRHQAFPWVGYAMPARVQRRDADILRKELKVNMVRTSHYPQSPHFLDRCDEVGLLVFEEIPGWQHIGDEAWQAIGCANVAEMICRDFNHPSIVLWGVRINESADNDAFYTRTNEIAHALDDTRQTGGVRCFEDSNLLEDVFTLNDFDPVSLKRPRHPLHLVTEFCGHMYPTKHLDNIERITEHARRHAHIQSQAAEREGIAGAIAWCAFDYNTHKEFGSGDRICHHGVADMFRIPKLAAGVYRAQCDPAETVVLEPAFHWSPGDFPGGGVGNPLVNSNCDLLKFSVGETYVAEARPARDEFPGLPHPPFRLPEPLLTFAGAAWHPLTIEGYLGGEKVISRTLSNTGIDHDFVVRPDDERLIGDGIDATRVWFMVTDEYGNRRNFAVGAIVLELTGPGEIIGDSPFPLIGGCGAVWVRTLVGEGTITLTAAHPILGTRHVRIEVARGAREPV